MNYGLQKKKKMYLLEVVHLNQSNSLEQVDESHLQLKLNCHPFVLH